MSVNDSHYKKLKEMEMRANAREGDPPEYIREMALLDQEAYDEYLTRFDGPPEEALTFAEWNADDTYISDTAPTRAAAARFRARARENPTAYDPFGLESKTVAEELEERQRKAEQGDWYPASGGSEQPFRTRSGRRLQYMWQPSTGHHAYYDVDSDLILDDETAQAYLGNGGGMSDEEFRDRIADEVADILGDADAKRALVSYESIWYSGDSSTTTPRLVAEKVAAAYRGGGYSENARGFHVFEMRGDKPLRQVNVKPLTLTKAQQLARIGAQNGKHARAVTTDPRKEGFRIVDEYKAGGR